MTSAARIHPHALPAVIAAMMDPAFFPGHPATVELRQTHISFVVMAGDEVYKVKKPVRFPYLDSCRLPTRRRLCEDEVRLNRRFCPDVYLGVVPIVPQAYGYALGDPGGDRADAVEYAVKMRRLDEARMLDRLVPHNADAEIMRAIASRLAEFDRTAETAQAWRYGSAAATWDRIVSDLRDYEALVGDTVSEPDLRKIEDFCKGAIEANWELINRRANEGRVREGHGDLRADQICIEDQVIIFDCVEFSEKFRCCDIVAEAAFLAMDLDHRGAAHLSCDFIDAYIELSRDDQFATLLPLHKCHRASIRGMVESQRSREHEVPEAEREDAREMAKSYFDLASRTATIAEPAVLAVCGLSGTGKSSVASALRNRLGYEVVSSDTVRKQLAKIPERSHVHTAYDQRIYSEDFNRRTYAAMLERAAAALNDGKGVILDATFRDRVARGQAMEFAESNGASIFFVECRCDENEVKRRLRKRAADNSSISDATIETYLRQREEFDSIDELSAQSHLVADTSESTIDAALLLEDDLYRVRKVAAAAE